MPHHELPLVKDLEGKGEDDDSQEAHQEVPSAVQPSPLGKHVLLGFKACSRDT